MYSKYRRGEARLTNRTHAVMDGFLFAFAGICAIYLSMIVYSL